MIFIDGGHDLKTVSSDIENCFKLSHSKTIIIIDDVVREDCGASWVAGPTSAWGQALKDNKVFETGYVCFKNYLGRGMVWGKYNLGA